jgi:hypothetical protein
MLIGVGVDMSPSALMKGLGFILILAAGLALIIVSWVRDWHEQDSNASVKRDLETIVSATQMKLKDRAILLVQRLNDFASRRDARGPLLGDRISERDRAEQARHLEETTSDYSRTFAEPVTNICLELAQAHAPTDPSLESAYKAARSEARLETTLIRRIAGDILTRAATLPDD